MSRIGNKKINLLDTKIDVKSKTIDIKSNKGILSIPLFSCLEFTVNDNIMLIKRKDDSKDSKSKHGLFRSLVYNAVIGLTQGYSYNLFLQGIGYRVQLKGDDLEFNLGYSHPVKYTLDSKVKAELISPTEIKITGVDKQLVGQTAAQIIELRPAKKDPYKEKGIQRTRDRIIKKVGKKVK